MEDLLFTPSTIIVWQQGQPHAKTPWTEWTMENPLLYCQWSWCLWGRKIVRCYQPTKTGRSARPVQQQSPVPA
jgi:hypothetical protein